MDGKKILKKGKDVVVRKIGEKVVLVPLYKSSDTATYLYTLNDSAAAVWSLIDGKRTLNRIIALLMDNYEISESRLEKEIDELCKDLLSIKALRD